MPETSEKAIAQAVSKQARVIHGMQEEGWLDDKLQLGIDPFRDPKRLNDPFIAALGLACDSVSIEEIHRRGLLKCPTVQIPAVLTGKIEVQSYAPNTTQARHLFFMAGPDGQKVPIAVRQPDLWETLAANKDQIEGQAVRGPHGEMALDSITLHGQTIKAKPDAIWGFYFEPAALKIEPQSPEI